MTVTSHPEVNAISSLPSETRERNIPQQKRRKKWQSVSLSISDSLPYLQIVSVEIPERVDPARNSYILVIQPHGIRAAGGQYTADEAYEIARATKDWDWSLNKDGQPRCHPKFEALLDQICKQSAKASELKRIEKSKPLFRIENATGSEQSCKQNRDGGAS